MKKTIVIGGVLVLGMTLGYSLDKFINGNRSGDQSESNSQIRENSNFKYINPLLECELGSIISKSKFVSFKHKIEKIIDEEKKAGNITEFAFYYRDLNNGPWFGINEREKFIPASLLKLPLSMTFYKVSEDDSSFLQKGIQYGGSNIKIDQYFRPEKSLEIDKNYTYPELVDYMLKYSDNSAALVLAQELDQNALHRTYSDLLLDAPTSANYSISVKDYSTFLRILFNASYLDKNNSEKVLSILSTATFNRGLRQGVPNSIEISHKFGEFYNVNSKDQQLHDCGIIYAKTGPYLLCVMSRGKNMDKLNEVIGRISTTVFNEVK